MIAWRRLQTLSRFYGSSCPKRKGLKDAYKKFSQQNLTSLMGGLKAGSIKYNILLGQAMAKYQPSNRQTYRVLKTAIRRDLHLMNRDDCMDILDILTQYKCDGDEQDIMTYLKNYMQNNADEFQDEQAQKLEDTLFLYHFNVKKLNEQPVMKMKDSNMRHLQREMQRMKIPKPKFKYDYDGQNSKLTIHDGNKKLRIVGIQHSVQWIQLMRREVEKADGLILELQPMFGQAKTKQQVRTEEDEKVKELIGIIRGVNEQKEDTKHNSPYLIQDVNKYLQNFQQSSSVVYHKGTKDIDEVRSLLKYVKNINTVLLCDLTFDEEIIMLAQKMSIQQLRQSFGLLRLMYINEQGIYLHDVARKGCMKCGSAQLRPPYEIADQILFPLNQRDNFMAENIHHYLKSTNLKNYCCFVGQDHLLPIFKRLAELYNKQGWKVDRELENVATLRPKVSESADKEQLVNKIALLESLFPRRLKALPKQLQNHRYLYRKLYDGYMALLHPFPISCKM